MKRYIVILAAVFALICGTASAYTENKAFNDNEVIVVMQPQNEVRMFANYDGFDYKEFFSKFNISEIMPLTEKSEISLFFCVLQ